MQYTLTLIRFVFFCQNKREMQEFLYAFCPIKIIRL